LIPDLMKHKILNVLTRYCSATVGLTFVAIGVALSIKSDIGTSPISCLPYVLDLCGGLSVGGYTALMHLTFILLQIILLRKKFRLVDLLQIPVAFLFGFLTDLFIWATSWIVVTTYFIRIVLTVLALICTAIGISVEVRSKAWMLAGEMLVSAISRVSGFKFRNVKIFFDSSLVVISAVLALIFFRNPLGSGDYTVIREGTLIFAIFTGLLMRLTDPLTDRILRKIID
ncbi:MAG: DUF6198 family protein, partial [Bacteroidales bacterium]|nr:DUF6198 family protein [Bacteroidales bacterium]